jgi:AsmA family protein
MDVAAFLQRHRRALIAVACAVAAIFLVLILILSFGWSHLRGPLERHFSSTLGRPVTIGAVRRIDHSLFSPEIQIGNMHVAQPAWVGGGDMIIIRRATVRMPLLPLLFGQARPHAITIDGLTVALVRRDATHANWKGLPTMGSGGGSLEHVTITHGAFTLDDRKRDHHLTAAIAADDRGFVMAGKGSLAGNPASVRLTGPALVGRKWPFRLDYRSAIANATLVGTADSPLDIGHFDAKAEASTDDLRHLDLLIEAGLPGTQPARLTANVRRDRPVWIAKDLRMQVGRSNFEGDLTVKKVDGRTKVNGAITSTALDFRDLASNEGLARAAAKRAALGPRILPDTAIHLEHMQKTDGSVRFDIQRLLFDKPSAFQGIMTTATLDHGVLTADPFFVRMRVGNVAGFVRVKHQTGTPLLTMDLKLRDARVEELGTAASGPLAAHLRLEGAGRNIREALSHANGTIGVVGGTGTINRRAALFLGSDAGRALFENKSDTTLLRCMVGHFAVKGGLGTADILVLDTGVSRSDGSGTINLDGEQIALDLPGRPKLNHAVKLDLPVHLVGTLSEPKIEPQSVPKTIGTFFKLVGNAIAGKHSDPAPDADCNGLAVQALR